MTDSNTLIKFVDHSVHRYYNMSFNNDACVTNISPKTSNRMVQGDFDL